MTKVIYYTTITEESPVKDFIRSLSAAQRTKISRIFTYIELYGLTIAINHVKKLSGTPLWEIRILGRDSTRILYATVKKDTILLLHGFVKKSQKTPVREIDTTNKRLEEWVNRSQKGS